MQITRHTKTMDMTHHTNGTGQRELSTRQSTSSRALRAFSALQHRNFRLFWIGQLISLIGTWMQTTGQSWLVLDLTKSALLLGVVGALQFLPMLVLGLFSGVLVDRFPKRTLLLITQTTAMILAAILWLLVLTKTVQLWHIFTLATLLGINTALDMPARQTFVVEMVGRKDLPNAIALNSSIFNLARIVGPGIAGLLIARFGEAPLFLFNAISFLPVITSIALIDNSALYRQARREEQSTARVSTLQSLREGFTYIRHMPAVLLVIATVGTISLFGINFNVTLPLVADQILRVGPTGFGFISSAFGVGALLAALWMAWRNSTPSLRQILIGGIVFGAAQMVFAISQSYLLSLLLVALVGCTQIIFSAASNALLQTVTPSSLRGRIMSVYLIVFAGTTPIGNLFIGALAHNFGPMTAILVGGALSLLAALAGWVLRKPAEQSLQESSLQESTAIRK